MIFNNFGFPKNILYIFTMEVWKNVKGYENLYQVSSEGRVKSLCRYVNNNGGLEYREGKIMKSCKHNKGYPQIVLCKEGKQKTYCIHRLVAQAFILNPNNYPVVNHKDEDKTNNKVENLEWCTSQYNNTYGTRLKKSAKSKSISILQFTKDSEFVKKWESGVQVQKELGFNHSSISSCCRGRRKTCGGYRWGYADDYERIPFNVFDLEIYEKRVA